MIVIDEKILKFGERYMRCTTIDIDLDPITPEDVMKVIEDMGFKKIGTVTGRMGG